MNSLLLSVELSVELPAGYRPEYAFAFHGRDAEGLAERIEGGPSSPRRIHKGVMLDGLPVLLQLDFDAWPGAVHCVVEGDGALGPASQAALHGMLLNMLGLRIAPEPFAAAVADDALFAPLVAREPGLRVIQSASVFEALSWAVIGQQINLGFAIALRRSFIGLAGRTHTSGLHCYPEAADAARLDLEQLTSRKFSRAKAETLLRLARFVADGGLDLRREADPDEVASRLLALKGIGPWTVNYGLLRGYGFADCSLEGDVAVRTAIGRLLGTERPGLPQAAAFLDAYRPQRTMAAAYLWASLNQPGA